MTHPSSGVVEKEEGEEVLVPVVDGLEDEGLCMDCESYVLPVLPVLLLEWYTLGAAPTGGYMQPHHSKLVALWVERGQDHRKVSLMYLP